VQLLQNERENLNHMEVEIVKSNKNVPIDRKISVIFICFGRYIEIDAHFNKTMLEIEACKEYVHLILVLDGKHLESAPFIKFLQVQIPDLSIVSVNKECSLPGVLYNVGLQQVKTQYVTFAWPGCEFSAEKIKQYISRIETYNQNEMVYYLKEVKAGGISCYPYEPLQYGWCQGVKLYSLNNMLIHQKVFKKIGGFNTSKLLQKYFDWDFMLRVTKKYPCIEIGENQGNALDFEQYPYSEQYTLSKDLAHRYLLRKKSFKALDSHSTKADEIAFINDLPLEEGQYVASIIKATESVSHVFSTAYPKANTGYKITIIGGAWEYHHNQMGFFNYLDALYGKNFGTYKVLMDWLVTIEEVSQSDLVIFTRCRHKNIIPIINACREKGIATLYMIDDNWLSVGKDYPNTYQEIFSPGKPDYDIFIEAIKSCKAVLVYNKYLEEDLKPYAQKIYRMTPSINLDFYKYRKKEKQQQLIIGYTGSYRTENSAFEALGEIGRENKAITILIFSTLSQEQEALFEGVTLMKEPITTYSRYCQRISEINPLILVAPLDACRTTMCKCANKYLDITAAGSVGIYSRVHPYTEVIQEGINGFLVEENTKACWKNKIDYLLNHLELLQEVRENSQRDIENNYALEVVIKEFCSVIDSVIRSD
jgi:hypothetical protein